MFLTVSPRTSTAIEELKVDGLKSLAIVTFKNGNTYAYENVSKRAILNVLFNPDISLGFWVNNNLVQSDRASVIPTEEYYNVINEKRERLNKLIKRTEDVNLPKFA
tara:strand:+ start:1729 stop:2046 length:318 start_codon:yes stop_codon:yes gene_type:complete